MCVHRGECICVYVSACIVLCFEKKEGGSSMLMAGSEAYGRIITKKKVYGRCSEVFIPRVVILGRPMI